MSITEIARCLYKPGHADYAEWRRALNALFALPTGMAQRVEVVALKQGWL